MRAGLRRITDASQGSNGATLSKGCLIRPHLEAPWKASLLEVVDRSRSTDYGRPTNCRWTNISQQPKAARAHGATLHTKEKTTIHPKGMRDMHLNAGNPDVHALRNLRGSIFKRSIKGQRCRNARRPKPQTYVRCRAFTPLSTNQTGCTG